jgi:hypothetical protein
MTRRKREKKPQMDRRLRPHLPRNQWHMFGSDPEKRAKLEERLDNGLSVCEAALQARYSDRHAYRLEWGCRRGRGCVARAARGDGVYN